MSPPGSEPQSLADIAGAVAAGAALDAALVRRARQLLYGEERLVARMLAADTVDRTEADLLWEIHRAHAARGADASWRQLFAEAITSHVLRDEISPGTLDDAEADYLLARIRDDRTVDDTELELLVSVISAVRRAPERFQTFVLNAVAAAVLADGAIDDDDVWLVRRVIHGEGSGGGRRIDERERQFLAELSVRAAGVRCSAHWHALLLEAGLVDASA